MNNINKWRFPGNGYTDDAGLDTADMETFKKDEMASLARELCQNSIDARKSYDKPVKIEFNFFEISRDRIPGINDLEDQILACIDTWKNNAKLSNQLKQMLYEIRKDNIRCLRISDFNTTGLVGVSGNDDSPWHYLVHGTGISNKSETSGGSKGIGKFATFVASYFNTVFYSTRTVYDEIGYQGICKLCSAKQKYTDEKTRGIGYFGSSDRNEPIMKEFNLDPTFSRNINDSGTDIFILGFKDSKNWVKDIISKILDSFMVAVMYETLSVSINGININKQTVKDIVYDENFINKSNRKSILSQYFLLTDNQKIFKDTLNVDEYGSAHLFIADFNDDENIATNTCIMVRYPFMKIKEINRISTIPCSCLCIIDDNDLNKVLRNVENPQHTDWEFKRIDDVAERNEIKAIYSDLIDQIKECVVNHLTQSDRYETDIEGAGEYIPGIEKKSENKQKEKKETNKILDKPMINKKKIKHKTINLAAKIEDDEGNGIVFGKGNLSGEDTTIIIPENFNNSSSKDRGPGGELSKGSESKNGNDIFKHARLRGMKYRFFCINKRKRMYGITFLSDVTEENVRLELNLIDASGSSYPVKIQEIRKNGEIIGEEKAFCFSIFKGEQVKIEVITDQEELFSGEVKLYAYR